MCKFSLIEIESIEVCKKDKGQTVWDLTIENEHSYCVGNNIIVHNCLTSTQTGVHYPMASLINDIYTIKKNIGGECKIVADGGIRCYSDIIKALALGADYVMSGFLFSKAATGDEVVGSEIEYYGMSTKRAQKEMGNTVLKTSEGKFLSLTKEYTLSGWVENFDSYLRSAMSYCDSRTLDEFREKSIKQVVSEETIKNVNNK